MHTYVSLSFNKNIKYIFLVSNEKCRYGEKLQDNFASLSLLYFDQSASVHVILPGFLD